MSRKNLLQLRRGNFSDWSISNPILASGEPGVDIQSNILKIGDGVSPWSDLHQIGGENLYYVKNGQGSVIRAGQCVYAKGAVGNSNSIEVGLFIGNGTIPEYSVMGLAKTDIGIGEFGYVSAFGTISSVDTYPNGNATNLADAGEYWEEGTILYASPTTAGKLTSNRPAHDTILAIVLKRNSNGKLFVRPSWNPHLDDLHDVAVSGAINGQFLQYNSLSGLWLPSNTGNFTFLSVNNIPVSISGHTHSMSDIIGLTGITISNVVYTTGSQSVSGQKTFYDPLNIYSSLSVYNLANSFIVDQDGFVKIFSNGYSLDTEDGSVQNFTIRNGSIDDTPIGLFIPQDGNFKTLTVNSSGVSITGHSHASSDITNFNSSVSGLLPLVSGTGFIQSIFENNIYKIGVTGLQLTGSYVSLTGAERISGTKTFNNNVIVTGQFSATSGYFKDYLSLNGTGVSITGHTHQIHEINNLQSTLNNKQPTGLYVSLTGIENISGVKTFIDNIIATGILQSPTGIFYKVISNGDFELNGSMNINAAASILASGPITFVGNPYIVSGVGYFTSGLFVGSTGNATPVSLSGHRQSYSTIDNFCTGVAECVNTPLLAGTGIILSFVSGTGLFIHFSGTSNYVSNTGNETVSGVKTFAQQIIATGGLSSVSGYFKDYLSLNGTGVSITGHSHQIYEITNLQNNLNNKQPTGLYVSLTGIENISGTKTFLNNVIVTGQFSSVSGYFRNYLSLNGTGVSITGHTHEIYQITNLQTSLNNKQPTGLYVSLSGAESISGTKTFNNNVIVTGQFSSTSGYFKDYLSLNGTGVSITGHTHQIYQITNLQSSLDNKQPTGVYVSLTGIENISGTKTFLNNVVVTGQFSSVSGYFKDYLALNGTGVSITGHTHQIYQITNLQSSLDNKQPTGLYVSLTGIESISGTKTFNNNVIVTGQFSATSGYFKDYLRVNGTGVSISGHTHSSSDITNFNASVSGLLPTALVYTTGNQTINGIKTFNDTVYAKTNLTVGIDSSASYTNGEVFNIAHTDSTNLVTINNGTTFSTSHVYLNAITQFNTPSFGSTPLIINPTGYLNTGAITQGYWRGSNIEVDKGGTGRSSYSNGQLLIGSGTSLVANTLTAGSGISITNGSGTITINTIGLQSSLIDPITGTGTNNYLSKWTSNSGLGNSLIYDNGTNVGIGTDSPAASLHLIGTGIVGGDLSVSGYLFASTISGTDPVTISSSTAGMIINDLTIFLQNDTQIAGYLRLDNETPDTIAVFDTDKNIVSLISPTLTELSYISGTSSNIQTQLDAKQATLINPVTGTGIANHIPYWSSSSGLLADSNQLIWDSTNNRLGIGIQSPTSQLHVVGGGLFSGDITASGSFIGGSGTALLPSFEFINDPDTGLFSPAANTFSISTSGVERLRINNIGNIGIGTISPSGQLHVIGTGIFSGRLGIGISGFPIWISQAATPHTFVHISGASGLFPDVNERAFGSLLRLNSGGSTNNPRIDFRIGGPGNYDNEFFICRNGADVIGIDTFSKMFLPNGFSILNPTNNGEGANASMRSYNDAASWITLDNNTRSMIIGYRGKGAGDQYINTAASGRLKIYNYYSEVATFDNRGRFGVGFSAPSGQVSINGGVCIGTAYNLTPPTNGLIVQGNVGIGTSSPNEALEVSGTIRITDGAGRVQFFRGGGTIYDYTIGRQGNHLAISTANDGTTNRYTEFGYYSGTTWTPKTRVNNYTGGISVNSTSAPSGSLDVTGDSYFRSAANTTATLYLKAGSSADTSCKIRTDTNGNLYMDAGPVVRCGLNDGRIDMFASSQWVTIGNTYDAGTANQYVSLVPANREIMRITKSGVGINTTTPSRQLHVIGTGIISSRLGINNNNPSVALDVSGTIQSTGLAVYGADLTVGGQPPSIRLGGYSWVGTNSGSLGVGFADSSSGTFGSLSPFFSFQGFNENVTSYNPICLTAGYFPQVYLNTDGNVGINTAIPQYALDVSGTGNFIGVKTSNISSNTTNVVINDASFTSTSDEYASFEADYNNLIYSRSSGGNTTYYADDGSFIEWSNEDGFWILYDDTYSVLVADYFSNYGILNPTYLITDGLRELLINGEALGKPLLRVGSLEFQPFDLNNAWIGENVYFNGSDFIRRQTGSAGLFYFQGREGQFRFSNTASSGTSVSSNPVWKITYDGTMAVGSGMSSTTESFTNAKFIINNSGNVGIRTISPSQALDVDGNIRCRDLYLESLSSPSIVSSGLTLNLANSQLFTVNLNSNITSVTISNTPSTNGVAIGFSLIFTADGTARSVTWPSGFKWAGGSSPTLTSASGKIDVLSFLTTNNGTNWLGFVGGVNY